MKITKRIRKVPTVLQVEAVECAAASLSMILQYYGTYLPLERLRIECGVSRDGAKAVNIIKAAQKFGLNARGFKCEPQDLGKLSFPSIIPPGPTATTTHVWGFSCDAPVRYKPLFVFSSTVTLSMTTLSNKGLIFINKSSE